MDTSISDQKDVRGEQGISISCYQDDVPSFVEAELERIYGTVFSSLAQFRIYGNTENASTYVVRQDGKAITVLLFLRHKRTVRVINEGIRIDEETVNRFAEYIFSLYRSVHVISFHAVQASIRRTSFSCQRFNCTEDIVVSLPGSAEEYLASLGKATRSYVNRYINKVKRSFSSFRFEVYSRHEVERQHILDIIQLNRARMIGKDKIFDSKDDEETQRMIDLVRECGFVGVAMINGRICAGTINYSAGENYFLEVVAHDPVYDDYRLGTLCCYLTICECIARGGREYHFLWGRYDYKFRLLGVQRDLDHLTVYRSRFHFMLNADVALQTVFEGYLRLAKRWLQQTQQNTVAARVLIPSMNFLRSVRMTVRGWNALRQKKL